MTMVRDLWDKGYIPEISKGYQWPAGQQTLATGKAAMELCGSWLPEELNPMAGPNFKWGGFRFPTVSGGVGSLDDLQQWQFAFIILKNSAHPKEAELFLKFLMTKDSQAEFSSGATYGVTRPGVDWPIYEADSEAASASAKVVFTHADGGTALHAEYTKNVFFANYLSAYIGKMTPAEFVQKMASDSKTYWANH
jgi:raffinose/stachyose/melibiose transport system substrate-binding protein